MGVLPRRHWAEGDATASLWHEPFVTFHAETRGSIPAGSLRGGAGADALIGGEGADRLEGGLGEDWLVGVSLPFQVTKDSKLTIGWAYTKGSDNFFKQGNTPKSRNAAAVGRGVVSLGYSFTF